MQDFLIVTFLIFVILLLLTAISSLLSGVPYVPTKKKVIEKLTKIVPLKNGEKVYDLGCGDGRLLFAL
ncbi:hypothetical protein HYV56_02390, partial [Candidatus Peregrinibacteria bacterium]|nr:hypothetical protein [Candidatus Peregrinibacteria bacterium]